MHFIPDHEYLAADMTDGLVITSESGAQLAIDLQQSPGSITVVVKKAPGSHGRILEADIMAANSVVVHKIDAVRCGGDEGQGEGEGAVTSAAPG